MEDCGFVFKVKKSKKTASQPKTDMTGPMKVAHQMLEKDAKVSCQQHVNTFKVIHTKAVIYIASNRMLN
jgi:hypothetical protein